MSAAAAKQSPQRNGEIMPAYIIGKLFVENWDWYREYKKTTEALVEKHGGRYLIKGGESEKLEGDAPLPHAQVLIEFPDCDSARNWYQDPAYSSMIELRNKSGVTTDLMLVEGFAQIEK